MPPVLPTPTPGGCLLASHNTVTDLGSVKWHLGIGGCNAFDVRSLAKLTQLGRLRERDGELGLLICLDIERPRVAIVLLNAPIAGHSIGGNGETAFANAESISD